eukprot:SAG22_NODE_19366_length_275_cov_1.357955_1_plen_53_part_01
MEVQLQAVLALHQALQSVSPPRVAQTSYGSTLVLFFVYPALLCALRTRINLAI